MIEDVPLSLVPQLLQPHDTGVSPTRTRRRFTAAYKLKILEAAAQCTKPGDVGALLRREGLYTSHLTAWRTAARRGELGAKRAARAVVLAAAYAATPERFVNRPPAPVPLPTAAWINPPKLLTSGDVAQ